MNDKHDGLQEIIDEALRDMAAEAVGEFDPQTCNLAEFCRRTGLSRQRARTIKANGFKAKPHGRLGLKLAHTVLSGHTGFVDDQLRKGVTNSQVVFERLAEQGYRGGLTTVKVYMAEHRDLVSARRRSVAPQGSRGQRFRSGPGESYQMDWGQATVAAPMVTVMSVPPAAGAWRRGSTSAASTTANDDAERRWGTIACASA